MEIEKEFCGTENSGKYLIQKPVLEGEILDLRTICINIPEGEIFHFAPSKNSISIFLFTMGAGRVKQGDRHFDFNEIAVYVPALMEDVSISAIIGNIVILEIDLLLSENELQELNNQQNLLPYFINYSQCKRYKESIKSDKTISRMLLPENIVPRFCMGSVQTIGPDKVDTHAHPMLEQLFLGLEKNDCVVAADGVISSFKENMLLHIPLGSEHGVNVEKNKTLNYIWMDFFRSTKDMVYISQNHFMDED